MSPHSQVCLDIHGSAPTHSGPADCGCIDVWVARAESAVRVGYLSFDELARLERISYKLAARTFCTARRTLRFLLARRLLCSPEEVPLEYGSAGKPRLAATEAGLGVDFNVSHSGEFIAIAISSVGHVGVDLEYCHPLPAVNELAFRILSEDERPAWLSLDSSVRWLWFYWFWTRKEAVSKLNEVGLAQDVRCLHVLPGSRSGGWALVTVNLRDLVVSVAARRPYLFKLHQFDTDALEYAHVCT